jgi:hypothetical protein
MFASGLHNQSFDEKYSNRVHGHVKSHPGRKYPEAGQDGAGSDRIEVSSPIGKNAYAWYW